ncbi:MAG: SAM-dependent methyltransferase [Rubrivivax sp.]
MSPAFAPGLAKRLGALSLCLAALAVPAAAQDEVPFITTPDAVTLAMLQLAGVGPADRLVDLGSGDGRIVITAARRFGARGLGVEIVPDLVALSRANARDAGVADRAEFHEQDLFTLDLAPFSVVTMYLLPQVNLQLRDRLLALKPGTRIVSHDWDLGDWRPDRSVVVDAPDKPIGRDKTSTVHLWVVPARLAGWWCGSEVGLLVRQHFQRVAVTMLRRGQAAPVHVFDGRARADGLHEGEAPASAGVVATLRADGLQMTQVRGVAALGFEGARLSASQAACF